MPSRPRTRANTRNKNPVQLNEEDDPPQHQLSEQCSTKSKSSKVNSEASIVLAKKRAELIAAKKFAELEIKRIAEIKRINKERIRSRELSVENNRSSEKSYITTSCKNKRTEEWVKKQKNETFDIQTNLFPYNIHKVDDFINISENKKDEKLTDIQILAKEIRDLRRPTERERDLPIFYGNVSEWIAFKAAYNRTKAHISEDEDSARLHRCLRGDARETVASLLQVNAPAHEIIENLELRYGRPELIFYKEINALKELPKLNDSSEQLNKFATKVRNCVTTMLSLNRPDQLFNTELIQSLKIKMTYLKSRWLTYAIEHESEDEPELVKISKFLQHEAISVTKHWIPEQIKISNYSKPSTSHRTLCLEDSINFNEEPNNELNVEEICRPTSGISATIANEILKYPYCDSVSHKSVKECSNFKLLTIDNRWNWAKNKKFCFKCLNSKHRRDNCRAKYCGINGCRMSHNRLLHATSNTPGTSQNTEPADSQAINIDQTS